jgi:hypothetical protein
MVGLDGQPTNSVRCSAYSDFSRILFVQARQQSCRCHEELHTTKLLLFPTSGVFSQSRFALPVEVRRVQANGTFCSILCQRMRHRLYPTRGNIARLDGIALCLGMVYLLAVFAAF